MRRSIQFLASLTLVASFGAGCLPPVTTLKVAEPLDNKTTELFVPRENGFGALPTITVPARRARVTVNAILPQVPDKITIIRLRSGGPNDTELRNIASAIGVPSGTISDNPRRSTLDLTWTDDQGYRWTYHTNERVLEFSLERTPSSPLTVSELPSNTKIISLANSFLLARAINPQSYRNAAVEPDWNNWWLRSKASGLCMNIRSLNDVRVIASSASLIAGGPPAIPKADQTTCVSPEFPSKAVIRYQALVDQRDVISADGKFDNGIELIVDTTKDIVIGGSIALFTDADRSDYPGLRKEDAAALLENGGITSVTGDVVISSVDFASYRIDSTLNGIRTSYLVPSLVGTGIRTLPDKSTETVRIVAPLLKQ